jgi:hypothetical protein
MATMPSRLGTAPRAIASVLPQVDELWLFLDRFEGVPSYADHPRIRVVRSQEAGDLRANGKFAALFLLNGPFTFVSLDDDIEYPSDYVAMLKRGLDRHRGAVVGIHAAVLGSPVRSYARDMKVLHRRSGQGRPGGVDLLGSDSLAFRTETLTFDVRTWPDVNMVDLSFALESRRRAVPLVMLPRPSNWVRALDENQADSIWAGVLRDDTRQTELAQELRALPRPRLPGSRWGRLTYRQA